MARSRVVRMAYAFDDQRQPGQRAQPWQVVPGQRVAEDRRPGRNRQARVLLRRRAQQLGEARIGEIIGETMAAELREVGGGEVARTPAGHPGIQGDNDRLEAGLLGPLDQARGELSIGWGIELEEAGRRLELGGDGFERVDRKGRGDHRHAGQRSGARSREIAMAVLGAKPDDADRAHEQRRRQLHAEELDREVALLGADEHPRRQAPFVERGDIGSLGRLVAAAAGDVGDEAVRHRRVRLGLKFVEAHREPGQAAAQAGKVDFVLVGSVVGHRRLPLGHPIRSSGSRRGRITGWARGGAREVGRISRGLTQGAFSTLR